MKKISTQIALIVLAAASMISAAQAAVPAAATTAITEAGTDMMTAVGAVITAMVAVWGLRKLGQKMGWL